MSNRHGPQLISLVFRLPRAKLERLAELAKRTRIRQSEFLREAIADLLAKYEGRMVDAKIDARLRRKREGR